MDIPSLIGRTESLEGVRTEPKIHENVFADLGLKLMISENMMNFMSYPASENNIKLRQNVIKEIFSDAIDDSRSRKTLKKFEELKKVLADISTARTNFNRSSSDTEKDILFITWALCVSSYINESKSFDGKSELINNYCQYFKSFAETDEHKKFTGEISQITSLLDEIRTYAVRVMKGKALVTKKSRNSGDLTSKVIKYANEINITDISDTVKLRRNIPISLVESFAVLNPVVFERMRKFRESYRDYIIGDTDKCSRECEFYIETAKLAEKLKERSIPVCFPEISRTREFIADDIYDISLIPADCEIIPNNAEFTEKENFYFLTGANGGGKTTYIRTVGIAVILALSGCFVPCRKAKIYPFKRVFTHFPKDERYEGMGRLVEEKKRADEILNASDKNSFVLFNETFSGTDEAKSMQMTETLGKSCYGAGIFGVYVTHIHGTADLKIPMLNVIVDTDNDNKRTFKVVRRDSVRSSYAYDILKKYGLGAERLAELVKKRGEVL